MSWRPGGYEIIGILFSGVVALLVVSHYVPVALQICSSLSSEYLQVAAWFVLAYTIGMLIQAISRFVMTLMVKVFKHRSAWDCTLSDDERNEIMRGLKEYYGFTGSSESQLERLCIGPVYDRMEKREIFIAVANFNRALATVSLLGAVLALAAIVSGGVLQLVIAASFLCMSGLFFDAYRRFSRYASIVVFSAFLAWWRGRSYLGTARL